MKFALTATALATLASTSLAQYISVIAAHSASPIHLQPLVANGEEIWIGKTTSAYCPKAQVGAKNCPKGKFTNFAGGDGSLSMGSEVPGGQQVYVDRNTGAVGYTQAHSAAVPAGAFRGGWSLEQGDSFGDLSWRKGLVACSESGDPNVGPWQVFGLVKAGTFGAGCIGFDALTSNQTQPAAWQYT